MGPIGGGISDLRGLGAEKAEPMLKVLGSYANSISATKT